MIDIYHLYSSTNFLPESIIKIICRFVAKKADRLIYIQSTYILVDEQKIEREYAPLEAIQDHYEKIVISLDDMPLPSRNGIRHVLAWKLNEIL